MATMREVSELAGQEMAIGAGHGSFLKAAILPLKTQCQAIQMT